MQENPGNDAFACGCIIRDKKGRNVALGFHRQFWVCAETVQHRLGQRALSPTSQDLRRLNRTYASDPNWNRAVWRLYRRLLP